jgi:hypothetical protein
LGPEPASYDPEKFVDGFQPWPRLLALKDGELLAKGEVFEHQTAARPKPAKHGSEPEPKQVKHGNKVIADPLAGCPTKLLISKPDRIVMRHNRRILGRNRKWRAYYAPKLKKRTALLAKLKEIFRQRVSHPVNGVIAQINPIVRGWVNYFAIGDSSRCFSYVRNWVEKKIRLHLMRARERSGFGWQRWSRKWLYGELGLHTDYRLRRPWSSLKVQPAEAAS